MNSNSIKSLLKLLVLITGVIALPFWAEATIPEGLWVSACNGGLLKTQTIDSAFHSKTTEQFHQDRSCQRLSFEFITRGELSFSQDQNIDFTYSEIQLVLYINEVVQDFNERQVCGFTNWKTGKAQIITGLACTLFNANKPTRIPNAGDMKYGIYKIENEHLFFGKLTQEKDGSSSERRPLEYDGQFYEFSKTSP